MSGKLQNVTFIALVLFLSSTIPVFSQNKVDLSNSLNAGKLKTQGDTTWKKIEFGANLNQGSFSSNWTGGGVNSIALGLFFNALSEKKKGKNSWRNDFQSQYGIVRNKGQQSRKNVDRIFFDTKYNRELTSKWSLFANINFLSQFGSGYEYSSDPDSADVKKKVSGILSPAYLTEAIGIEYRPVPYFFIDFAPGALRQTIVVDKDLYVNTPDQKNYGVPIGKRVRTEAALIQMVANFDKDIAKSVNLKFRYLLFSSFKHPLNIDNRLDAMLTAKVNKFVNVNLGAIVVYDEDQSDKIQFAQALSIGFLYSF
ncbi:DUF3078 domain-containing protein [Dyadobacter pollutisoli]|jgi:hypothetical protein|uniref:DUF3078 domain-containing protein n=1 Tax=Dyadobacter pollutisoli TaxID=2910158 RepID=A0A9E8N8X3_9BACT|nr:DUF3078 domain-containing protein [Dyadobacter pollutisoli]WAC10672.1 DUF3078 domain-containing protein [Dyadobacter pollutisoli]